jgi:hypothetical protein
MEGRVMKRFLLAGLIAVVGGVMVPTALSGALKLPIYAATDAATCGSSASLSTTQVPGHVNLNTPSGAVALIVNGAVTMAPNTTYTVWVRNFDSKYGGAYVNKAVVIGYYALGTFTSDAFGSGEFHYNLLKTDLPAGTYQVQVAINTGTQPYPGAYGCSVAATTLDFPSVTVGS